MSDLREELAKLLRESQRIGVPASDDYWLTIADRLLPFVRAQVDAATHDLKEQVAGTHDLISVAVAAERERCAKIVERELEMSERALVLLIKLTQPPLSEAEKKHAQELARKHNL